MPKEDAMTDQLTEYERKIEVATILLAEANAELERLVAEEEEMLSCPRCRGDRLPSLDLAFEAMVVDDALAELRKLKRRAQDNTTAETSPQLG